MTKRLIAALLVLAPLGLLTAAPASADTRHCYTPHVGPFPSYEVCYWLPGLT